MSKKKNSFIKDAGLGAILGGIVGTTYHLAKKGVKLVKKLIHKDEEVLDDAADTQTEEEQTAELEEATQTTDEE